MKKRMVLSATIAGLGVTFAAAANDYNYRIVAKTGDTAVGTSGGQFTVFGPPTINNNGLVAFTANTAGSATTSGMWWSPGYDPDSLELLAGTLGTIPGVPDTIRFGDFNFNLHMPRINDAGNIGFSAPLNGIPDFPNQIRGLFRKVNGTLEKVVIPGDTAPGAGSDVTFSTIVSGAAFNENNLVAFNGFITGPGVNSSNNEVLYLTWFGGLSQVMREGSPVPGLPGATFNGPAYETLLGNNGRVAFGSNLTIGNDTVMSHWSGWPGLLTLAAKGGDVAPVGWPFANQATFALKRHALTENGLVFFHDVDAGGLYKGLWFHDGNTVHQIAMVGTPGPISAYADLKDTFGVGADGTCVFRARLSGPPPHSDTMLVRRTPGQAPIIIAREGDPVGAGYWEGVTYGDFMSSVWDATIMDNAGRMYFQVTVNGPGIDDSNDEAMWAVEPDGTKRLIMRKGQQMDLGDGIARQVDGFSIHNGVSMHSGRRPSVTNAGAAALRATFTDGTSAIVVAERYCLGDLNGDGSVDVSDLLMLLAAWGNCHICAADMNKDGVVDVSDLLMLLGAWGMCP